MTALVVGFLILVVGFLVLVVAFLVFVVAFLVFVVAFLVFVVAFLVFVVAFLVFVVAFLVFVVAFLVFVDTDIHEFDRVDQFAEGNKLLLISIGISHQFREPSGFESNSYAEHQIGVRDSRHVARSGLERVRIGPRRQQAEHLHTAAANDSRPIGDEVGRRHDADHRVFFNGGRRWRGSRLLGARRDCE